LRVREEVKCFRVLGVPVTVFEAFTAFSMSVIGVRSSTMRLHTSSLSDAFHTSGPEAGPSGSAIRLGLSSSFCLCVRTCSMRERENFIDNLLVRVHLIIERILVDRPCTTGV